MSIVNDPTTHTLLNALSVQLGDAILLLEGIRKALEPAEVDVQPVDPRAARGIRPGQGVQESLERRGW